jgi:endonuclease/exonuclease/phosphatase (EEP) superfamily protein YafD
MKVLSVLIFLLLSCSISAKLQIIPLDQSGEFVKKDALKRSLRTPFSFTSWNVCKGCKGTEGFPENILNSDLLLIQEFAYDPILKENLLGGKNYSAYATSTFMKEGEPFSKTGVMIASKVKPIFNHCTSGQTLHMEPLTGTPKSFQHCRFLLPKAKVLLVLNVHGINFNLGKTAFLSQVQQWKKVLTLHYGPVIFAGDFNFWNNFRYQEVKKLADSLGLTEVTFDPDYRSKLPLLNPFDSIFYRGLKVVDSQVLKTEASDHNPLTVQFSL